MGWLYGQLKSNNPGPVRSILLSIEIELAGSRDLWLSLSQSLVLESWNRGKGCKSVMEWYYANNRQQQGPVDETEFQDLVREGVIREDTLIWREGMENWRPFGEYKKEVFQQVIDEAEDEGLDWVDVTATPRGSAQEAVSKSIDDQLLASLGARAIAKIIDFGVTFVFIVFLTLILSPYNYDIETLYNKMFIPVKVFELLYSGYFLGKYGATPGKLYMGIEVVFENGARMNFARGMQRQAAEWFGIFIFGAGYVMAAFDARKRTLQDWVCRTIVVRRKK